MDLFDILEVEFDEFFDELIQPRRDPVIRPNYMETLDDTEFRIRFRLTKNSVYHIYSLIVNQISSITERNFAISPMNRLLLTLRYYATGSFINVLEDFTGISKASASRIVNLVSQAIAQLRPQFVKFPEDTIKLQEEFYDIARFPRLIGAIGCTHVPIKSPGGHNVQDYRDKNSQFSFNIQTIVSANLKIMDIVARWPGGAHNQTIFNNSFIKQRLLNGEFGSNCLIVGDKGYVNTFYLLTPLQTPTTSAERLYNESQIRSRNVVDRTFGVWKNRFPVLSKKIQLHVSRVQPIIVACAVLHNIAIDTKDTHFDEISDCTNNTDNEYNVNTEDVCVRNRLINDYFASLPRYIL